MKSNKAKVQKIRDELSDVVIYCLSMANSIEIDPSDSVLEKLEIDRRKYPADLYKGRADLDP
jgi:NTP pyrophosphatase (non-canonical NTP hydrolase)